MNIFIYHGKCGDEYFLADTQARLDAAMMKIFKHLDEWGHCYDDDEDQDEITLARAGDLKALRVVMSRRSGYEYEGWDVEEAVDALANQR